MLHVCLSVCLSLSLYIYLSIDRPIDVPRVYYYGIIISRVLQSSHWPPSLMSLAIKASLIHTVRKWVWEHTAATAKKKIKISGKKIHGQG